MKNDLAKRILDKKLHCVFISPHFDDAILSSGSLIAELNGKVDITIVNVFTKAHKKPYTLSARKFLFDLHYNDAEELYEDRKKEDEEAFSSFSVSIVNLGFEDALFRRKEKKTRLGKFIAEFDHLYPTYRWHIIKKINTKDYALSQLEKQMEKYNNKKFLIFAPYGIGNHADHKIARLATEHVFDRYVLYSDFPYSARLHTIGKGFKDGEAFTVTPNMAIKAPLIRAYKTQFRGLFANGVIPDQKELYFSNQKL